MIYSHSRAPGLFVVVQVIQYDTQTPSNTYVRPLVLCFPAEFTVFRPSSFHIMLQTNFGLQIQVQLVPVMQIYITLDQSFQTKTCGGCSSWMSNQEIGKRVNAMVVGSNDCLNGIILLFSMFMYCT